MQGDTAAVVGVAETPRAVLRRRQTPPLLTREGDDFASNSRAIGAGRVTPYLPERQLAQRRATAPWHSHGAVPEPCGATPCGSAPPHRPRRVVRDHASTTVEAHAVVPQTNSVPAEQADRSGTEGTGKPSAQGRQRQQSREGGRGRRRRRRSALAALKTAAQPLQEKGMGANLADTRTSRPPGRK